MNFFIVLAILINVVFEDVFGAHLPSNIRTCSRRDENFDECVRSNGEDAIGKLAKGNTQLGIIPFEPLSIELISVGRVPGSSVNIDQKFSNIKLHGLSESKIDKVHVDLNTYDVYIESTTPVLRSEADFEIKGQLLIFPINGKGPSNVTMTNLKAYHNITCQKYEKRGKQYVRLTDYQLTVTPEKIAYKFDNVVGGSAGAMLAEQIHRVINDNAITVFEEVRVPTEQSYAAVFRQIANKIFTKVPLNEIFRD